MSDNATVETVVINIDGQDVEVPKGTNAIEAAQLHGKEIPHYCYHPKLSVAGNCRMCLIEMGMPMRDRATGDPILDADGTQKIGWGPKPTIGCATTVAPGMHLRTDSPMVKEARNGVTAPFAIKPASVAYKNFLPITVVARVASLKIKM
jgi:NADH-quinone oxidoreductase subunit G